MPIKTILSRLTKPVFDVVEKAVVNKDEKNKLKHDLEIALIDTADFFEAELTRRHEMDMKSDSWLSKNVRPLTLVFLMFMFSVISIFDGNIGQFSIDPKYIPVYEMLLMVVMGFYFGGRTLEKSVKMYKSTS